jgi:hypothetical protein
MERNADVERDVVLGPTHADVLVAQCSGVCNRTVAVPGWLGWARSTIGEFGQRPTELSVAVRRGVVLAVRGVEIDAPEDDWVGLWVVVGLTTALPSNVTAASAAVLAACAGDDRGHKL